MADWRPEIAEGPEPLYERLVSALRADIASGVLGPGDKVPPQRDLAHRMGIGLGTVTRAYAEATRRGLLRAQVGSGSYVSMAENPGVGPASGPVDMTRTTIPAGPAATRLSATLAQLRRRPDLLEHLAYAPPEGFEAHRRAGAAWLQRAAGLHTADWRRLVCTGGGQQAMALVFGHLCRPGDTVMTEAATFFGFKSLAEVLGLKLQGLAMDSEGLLPEAVDRAAATGLRVLYLMPTLQNPTTRLMSPARRAEIAAVARRRDLLLVEDDSYAVYGPGPANPPIATLAPERSWYVGALSKGLAPGLRAGFLVAPSETEVDRLIRRIHALYYAPAGLGSLVGTQWIEDGTADDIAAETRAEFARRLTLAREVLGDALETPPLPATPHIWLPMDELAAERVAARAHRSGVEVTPPSAPLVDPALCSGLRLCLGGAQDLSTLERGLRVVASALGTGPDERTRGLV